MTKLSKGSDNIILYFVEGQTEKALIASMNVFGKPKIVNLWQNDVKKILPNIESKTKVFVIFDIDVIDANTLQRFHDNLKILCEKKLLVGLLQQTKNLEDELVYSCNSIKSHKQLFDEYNACSASEFKASFSQHRNPFTVLVNNGFDINKIWQRGLESYIDAKFHVYKTCGSELPSKP